MKIQNTHCINTVKSPENPALKRGLNQDVFCYNPSFSGKKINSLEAVYLIQSSSLNVLKSPFSEGVKDYKDFIDNLSKVNGEVLKKKIKLLEESEKEKSNRSSSLKIQELRYFLLNDDITPLNIKSLFDFLDSDSRASSFNFWGNKTDRLHTILTGSVAVYNDYDKLSIREKLGLIKDLKWSFQYADEKLVSSLYGVDNIAFFRDLKRAGSIDKLINYLNEKIYESPVKRIEVTPEAINGFENAIRPDNIRLVLNNINLEQYNTTGLPLEFSRKDFVLRFKMIPDWQRLCEQFNFNIDENDDIIGFPNPNGADINPAKKLIEDFTVNNRVVMPDNKKAEEFFNAIIKAFPELTSVTGKKQNPTHDSTIDIHTLKVIKHIVNHPEFEELKDADKRLLIIAALFHDTGKKEGVVHYEHPQQSAVYVKEVIKKLNLDALEKERIFNQIDMGHWAQYMSDGSKTAQDVAAVFRHHDDFKMARIFSQADLLSVNYNLFLSLECIQAAYAQNVKEALEEINKKGVLLFADDIPDDYSKFPKTPDGVMILDFTNKNADISHLGFKKGTKVRDLKMLAHSSNASAKELNMECDCAHKICLSTSMLDNGDFRTLYNNKTHIIVKPVNSDIAVVSKGLCASGFKRGFEEFKKYLFETQKSEYNSTFIDPEQRRIVSDIIRDFLGLDAYDYATLYEQVSGAKNIDEIQDVVLEDGRRIDKEEIIYAIRTVQQFLQEEIDPQDYKNEVVVFNPKIAAFVEDKQEFTHNRKLRQVARENNIPVILV